jgi:hypothetical protein
MRIKLKYALPLVQMLVAWAVLDWTWLFRYFAFNNWGPTPPIWFVMMMSFPSSEVVLLAMRWSEPDRLNLWLFMWLFIALVGVLWYWVLRNVEAFRETGRPWLHLRPALRVAEDVALIALGFFSLFVALTDFHLDFVLEGPRVAGRFWPWAFGAVLCNMGWFVGLVFFFGRDLVQTLRSSNPRSKRFTAA